MCGEIFDDGGIFFAKSVGEEGEAGAGGDFCVHESGFAGGGGGEFVDGLMEILLLDFCFDGFVEAVDSAAPESETAPVVNAGDQAVVGGGVRGFIVEVGGEIGIEASESGAVAFVVGALDFGDDF